MPYRWTHLPQVGIDDEYPLVERTIAPDEIELPQGFEQVDNYADLGRYCGLTCRLLITSFRQVDKIASDALLCDGTERS